LPLSGTNKTIFLIAFAKNFKCTSEVSQFDNFLTRPSLLKMAIFNFLKFF
jgi:hypothetical protein